MESVDSAISRVMVQVVFFFNLLLLMSESQERAGTIAIICSFLFPIVGLICYFVNKEKVENASAYIYSALGGIALGILFRVLS